MALARLVRRTAPLQLPARVVLYGVEGIGKTSWAAGAPRPIFIAPEDGFGLLEVDAFPVPQRFRDVEQYLRALLVEDHGYQTLVIDTIDWLEGLLFDELCERAGCDSIEDVGGGFGKGYTAAVQRWRALVVTLDKLRAKGMRIVGLAHSHTRSWANPEGANYDRFEMRMNPKGAAVWKDWSDVLLFANYEVQVATQGRAPEEKEAHKKGKAIGDGRRVVYTSRRPQYDAKNRFNLPDKLPLAWSAFAAAMPTAPRPAASSERWSEDARAAFEDALLSAAPEPMVAAIVGTNLAPLDALASFLADRGWGDLDLLGDDRRAALLKQLGAAKVGGAFVQWCADRAVPGEEAA